MSAVLSRVSSAVHQVATKLHLPTHSRPLSDEEEAMFGVEYAATLGLHLTADEQLAQFKRDTEGAPLVQRPLRRRLV